MRVLLIASNTESFPEPVFPIGAVYVAGALQRQSARVMITDLGTLRSVRQLKKDIEAFRPDCIGVSLRNIDNAAYPAVRYYVPSYVRLIKSIRSFCSVPVILGGPAFSLFPEEIAACLGADAGVKGESEKAVQAFREPGMGKIVAGGLSGLEDTAFPENIHEVFPAFRRYRTIGVQTARGCTGGCIYCTYPRLEGNRIRSRDPEIVASEIQRLFRDFGKRDFFIVDSLFNADENHMVRVLESIAALNLPIRFSCYLRPKVSDPGIFALMKSSGCVAVDFGTDTGSPSMLASLRKPFSRDDIRAASLACREAGMDFCHSLILGGPLETSETLKETVRLMDEISPSAVVAMTGIRIYPGTGIERMARDEGILAQGDTLLDPRFYFPPMGPHALLKCAYEAVGSRRSWFFPGKRDWGSALGFRIVRFLYRRRPLWRVLGE